eukprot:COSAG01_NODE_3223_length_6394_cov_10.166005_1_plen_52_part_00
MIIYDYHFYSSLKIDLEFYRIDKLHASGGQIQSADQADERSIEQAAREPTD